MIRENDEQALREYSNRKKRYKKRRNLIICMLILVVVVVGASYVVFLYNRSYHNYKTIKSIEITGENGVNYLTYGSSVIKYGKNGAVAYDKDDKVIWNDSYEMSDPIADICGKYVVVADRGNKTVHIYNEKGSVGSYSTLYNISKVEVAAQGVVVALMKQGKANYIIPYDIDGTDLGVIKNTVNNAGYPLDLSMSDDAKKLVIIYLSVSSGDLVSNVVCYNLDEVGKSYKNKIVGGYKFNKGIVAARVEFINNNNFCIYKDNGFDIYSMKQKPTFVYEEDLKGKILSILSNKENIGVVLEPEDGSAKHLMLYNLKGKKILDKTLDFDYKKIFLTEKEIIMYDEISCHVMKMNGKVKLDCTFDGNISGFYPIDNVDRYYLINETELSTIKLTQ